MVTRDLLYHSTADPVLRISYPFVRCEPIDVRFHLATGLRHQPTTTGIYKPFRVLAAAERAIYRSMTIFVMVSPEITVVIRLRVS